MRLYNLLKVIQVARGEARIQTCLSSEPVLFTMYSYMNGDFFPPTTVYLSRVFYQSVQDHFLSATPGLCVCPALLTGLVPLPTCYILLLTAYLVSQVFSA